MYKFNWSEIVTDSLLATLSEITGAGLDTERVRITPLLASIFKSTGGLPVTENIYEEQEKTDLAVRILSEALDRYLLKSGISNPERGYYLSKSTNPAYEMEIIDIQKVNVNSASPEQLESLPVFGKTIADAIIKERSENGLFNSFDDLAQRIKGIGNDNITTLMHAVFFDDPVTESATRFNINTDFESKLTIALSLIPGNTTPGKVAALFDIIASTIATEPHPQSKDQMVRSDLRPDTITTFPSDWLAVLASIDYFKHLPDIIKAANVSIKLTMFHIALPQGPHPTKILLDELINAKARGVEVKVMLDQDRETDLYKSTIINTAAKKYLEENGIQCKYDSKEVLLHSKYMIVDNNICVVGSHNWSAGSYFQFDDLSFVVSSNSLGQQLSERFEQLWSA